MNHVQQSVPAITASLRSKGRNTVGHETNLARSPIWQSRSRPGEDETIVTPLLFGHPFRKVEGHALTTSDQRLFAHLTTSFVRSGCPDARQVAFSLGEAATAVGYEALGGRQRSLMRASLSRLRSVTFESALRHPDGSENILGWGLIDTYLVTSSGGGKGWVKISEPVAHLLREGSVTFLHAPTWEAICREDEVAGRLWSFLESESIGPAWRYSLFAPEAMPRKATVPAIADILQLRWSSRKRVAKRIREACAVIEAHDRRYRLSIATGKGGGAWVLTCSRTRSPRVARGDSIPAEVMTTWRRVHRSHLPSQRQRAILFEILGRHSAGWVVEQLRDGATADPFAYLLSADRASSRHALTTARDAELRWEQVKAEESAQGEQSLADLIGRVRHLVPVPSE